jgi:hypothetical protein
LQFGINVIPRVVREEPIGGLLDIVKKLIKRKWVDTLRHVYLEKVNFQVMEDQTQEKLPDFDISRAMFILQAPQEVVFDEERSTVHVNLLSNIISGCQSDNYKLFCSRTNTHVDLSIEKRLEEANAAELAKLDEDINRNTEAFGDVEVKNALLAKANFFIRIGRKEDAIASLEAAYSVRSEGCVRNCKRLNAARIILAITCLH